MSREYPVMKMRRQIALCRRGWAHADHPARLGLAHSASWSHQVSSKRFLLYLIILEVFECVSDSDGCPARPSDVASSAVYLTLRDGAQLQEAVRAAGSAMHGLLS